jgi:hypothetical protein
VLFAYAKANCGSYGFYGWAVVLGWTTNASKAGTLRFRPVAPSDRLKMRPWGTGAAMRIFDDVRGRPPRGTLWFVEDARAARIADGITSWLSGAR